MNRDPISKSPKDIMTSAYILLFEIETSTRHYIKITLTKTYGFNWQYILSEQKPIENTRLDELLEYFSKYPPLTSCFTPLETESFSKLIKIRNKVAHMRYITDEEYLTLEKFRDDFKFKFKGK